MKAPLTIVGAALVIAAASSCAPLPDEGDVVQPTDAPVLAPADGPTAIPERSPHPPGELVDYAAQSGDTLPAIAAHFNTTVDAILEHNPDVPSGVSTLPPGYPLRIPAYFLPLSASAFQMLPDSEFVNGPSAVEFDVRTEVMSRPGWLAGQRDYAFGRERPAWEVVEVVARNYSVHPRLLLSLLEYGSRALSQPFAADGDTVDPLGIGDSRHRGLNRQLIWAAERLNDGFYGWRTGELREFELADGLLARPDPWANPATVGLQLYFASLYGQDGFNRAVNPEGFYTTYAALWGDPFSREIHYIPGNLQQPEFGLPFMPDRIWDFTGGPHPSWGDSLPWGALDFAPPAMEGGCALSSEWIAAPASGHIVRSSDATVILDLDSDQDERTGWVLMFFHVATQDRVPAGTTVQRGDPIGYPSCEGGRSTGTHFHLARRYNGEWLPAGGPLAFNLEGWIADYGPDIYLGSLTKGSREIAACTCSTRANRIFYEFPSAP